MNKINQFLSGSRIERLTDHYSNLNAMLSKELIENIEPTSAVADAFFRVIIRMLNESGERIVLSCLFCNTIAKGYAVRFEKNIMSLIQPIYSATHNSQDYKLQETLLYTLFNLTISSRSIDSLKKVITAWIPKILTLWIKLMPKMNPYSVSCNI